MKVARLCGLADEAPAAKKRHSLHRDTASNRLTIRDAAIVQLRRLGWTRQELEFAFGLSARRVREILADLREFRAAVIAFEQEAA